MARVLGSGRPLDGAQRASFEPWLGTDLGAVRVHTGAASEHAAADLDASAFTIGSHIAFGRGAYRPWSDDGRRLLAHELAHVVQASGPDVTPTQTLSRRNDPAEREADRVAEAGAAGAAAPALGAIPAARIARQQDPASASATANPAAPVGGPPRLAFGQLVQLPGRPGYVSLASGQPVDPDVLVQRAAVAARTGTASGQ